MLLQDKVAVIYGAGGAIGGAVARAFASEGARVFLTGRSLAPVQAVADELGADAAAVDALDERAVAEHLRAVIEREGRVDISFNAVGIPEAEVVGVPLLDTDVERLSLPIAAYTRTCFLTARHAARHMVANRSGAILFVSALPGRGASRLNGGYGPAHAAKEALVRDLSAELAPHGVRVVGLRPHALPETATMREVFAAKADALGIGWEQFRANLVATTHPRRVMAVEELASVAAFVASDRAGALTGTTVNLTMGSVAD